MDFQSAKSFGKLRLRTFQPYHQYYICRHCRYKARISNAFNAIYVDTVNTKDVHTFLPIYFLNIQLWFSILIEFWKAETQGFSTIPIIPYMQTQSPQGQGSLMHSMLSMATLSRQFWHLIVLCIRCCVRATSTSVDTVNKHRIGGIACFDLHIVQCGTNGRPYWQYTIALLWSFVSTILTCLHVHSNYKDRF